MPIVNQRFAVKFIYFLKLEINADAIFKNVSYY